MFNSAIVKVLFPSAFLILIILCLYGMDYAVIRRFLGLFCMCENHR